MWEITFLKNLIKKEVEGLVPELFLFFTKAVFKAESNGKHLVFHIMR